MRTELAGVVNPPDLLARWCRIAQEQTRSPAGDPDDPVRLLHPDKDDGFAGAVERVALGKAQLARGEPDGLALVLAPLTGPDVTFLGPSVEARILLALAADQRHRETAALELITAAIDLAEPEAMTRPFLDAGPAAGRLITRHRLRSPGTWTSPANSSPARRSRRCTPSRPPGSSAAVGT